MFAVVWEDRDAGEVRCLRVAKTEEKAFELMGEVRVPNHARMSQEDLEEARAEFPDYQPAGLKVIDLTKDEMGDQVLEDLNSYLENTEEDAFDY